MGVRLDIDGYHRGLALTDIGVPTAGVILTRSPRIPGWGRPLSDLFTEPELAAAYAKASAVVSAESADLLTGDRATAKLFLAVAERGGFGAAASKLHLSQSRVSAHIAALEELLAAEA